MPTTPSIVLDILGITKGNQKTLTCKLTGQLGLEYSNSVCLDVSARGIVVSVPPSTVKTICSKHHFIFYPFRGALKCLMLVLPNYMHTSRYKAPSFLFESLLLVNMTQKSCAVQNNDRALRGRIRTWVNLCAEYLLSIANHSTQSRQMPTNSKHPVEDRGLHQRTYFC